MRSTVGFAARNSSWQDASPAEHLRSESWQGITSVQSGPRNLRFLLRDRIRFHRFIVAGKAELIGGNPPLGHRDLSAPASASTSGSGRGRPRWINGSRVISASSTPNLDAHLRDDKATTVAATAATASRLRTACLHWAVSATRPGKERRCPLACSSGRPSRLLVRMIREPCSPPKISQQNLAYFSAVGTCGTGLSGTHRASADRAHRERATPLAGDPREGLSTSDLVVGTVGTANWPVAP